MVRGGTSPQGRRTVRKPKRATGFRAAERKERVHGQRNECGGEPMEVDAVGDEELKGGDKSRTHKRASVVG